MKSVIPCMIVAASLVISGAALAAEPAAAKSKCNMCHALNKKLVGPSYTAIAEKYKGDNDAAAKMAVNITKGGAFGWKLSNMPPRGMGASDTDIKAMSEYIAGLAK